MLHVLQLLKSLVKAVIYLVFGLATLVSKPLKLTGIVSIALQHRGYLRLDGDAVVPLDYFDTLHLAAGIAAHLVALAVVLQVVEGRQVALGLVQHVLIIIHGLYGLSIVARGDGPVGVLHISNRPRYAVSLTTPVVSVASGDTCLLDLEALLRSAVGTLQERFQLLAGVGVAVLMRG